MSRKTPYGTTFIEYRERTTDRGGPMELCIMPLVRACFLSFFQPAIDRLPWPAQGEATFLIHIVGIELHLYCFPDPAHASQFLARILVPCSLVLTTADFSGRQRRCSLALVPTEYPVCPMWAVDIRRKRITIGRHPNTEDVGDTFLQNISNRLQDYTASESGSQSTNCVWN
jgi:hypothetical protein